MITGTIGDDGAVGQVGGVLEKARAAKNAGARVFLVPPNQSTETYTHPVESCIKETGFIFCETTYKKKVVSIGEEVGLDVKEITNIRDALPYFF
jgi:uncharacterized protein